MEERWATMRELTEDVIGSAVEVHRALGPGLLESTYEECLCRELALRSIPFRRQVTLPIEYKGLVIEDKHHIDLLIHNRVVVELKSIEAVLPVHHAQLLTYLRLGKCPVGLLINFHGPVLTKGSYRKVWKP